jgi:ubiquinone/menaquinone biosynthesis C-methylase UbiE
MDPRLQRRIQRYGWDKAARVYEEFWARQLAPAQERLLERAALTSGQRVVEVACGTGLVSVPVAEAIGPTGRLVATDISQAMVDTLRGVVAERGLTNVETHRMDGEALDVPDASFDVALCSLGHMYVPDPIRSLAEMTRTVAPGGRVVSSVWGDRRACGWAEIFPIVDRRVESEVCPMFFQLGSGDALRYAMESAGLGDLRVDRITTTLLYASVDDALGAAFMGGPVALAYSRFDEKTRHAVHEEYLASIESYRDGEGYRIPGEFVVGTGMRSAASVEAGT